MSLPRIEYAVDFFQTDNLSERVTRARQSAAAARMLERLEIGMDTVGARTKSHSRVAFAVAISSEIGAPLGIDVEYIAIDRPCAEIARFLGIELPAPSPGPFYRAWTFCEAYFKAFQVWPPSPIVAQMMSTCSTESQIELTNCVHVLTQQLHNNFQLCLVWHSEQRIVPKLVHLQDATCAGAFCR